MGLIWLASIAGSVLYALLGINRIRQRAVPPSDSELGQPHRVPKGDSSGTPACCLA
jgi:hypothetical protein